MTEIFILCCVSEGAKSSIVNLIVVSTIRSEQWCDYLFTGQNDLEKWHYIVISSEITQLFLIFIVIKSKIINFAFNLILCKMEDINRLKVVLAEKRRTNSWLASELGENPATVSKWCTNTHSQIYLPLNR